MRLCFYVIRSFLPSLPRECRHTHHGIKTSPVYGVRPKVSSSAGAATQPRSCGARHRNLDARTLVRCAGARVKAAVAPRNALDLCDCTRLCAADGGADQRVQAQEQLERPALAARAAGTGRAVNFMAEEQCCRWLLHGALRLCGAAAHALQHSLTAQAGPTRPSQAGRAVPAACA